MQAIAIDELKKICKDPVLRKSLALIDVSSHQQFEREHAAYSFHVPLEGLEKKKESGLPKDRLVVCYGPSAEDAEKAAAIYRSLGFQARAFREGLEAWKSADLPTAK